MSKVLISFLGAVSDRRSYWPANYLFPDGKVISSSFIAKALRDYHSIDRLILIGTAHSMWEEVYREIGCNGEEDVFCSELFDKCLSSNHSTNCLEEEDIRRIEEKLGKGSKIVIIKYGLNDDEIAYNTQAILGIEKYLNSGDIVYLDITHSFRSLPIYLMNCLIFLKNVSKKQIDIKSISYGMLDVSKEYPTGIKDEKGNFCEFFTPVVELGKLMEVQEWITGAYNFQKFGNTYKIAKLLEAHGRQYQSIIEPLRKFAEVKNLNYISDFKSQIQGLSPLRKADSLPPLGQMVVTPIMRDFLNEFSDNIRYSTFQYRMAVWHQRHHNYGYALMLLVEACVTYCCEEMQIDYENSVDDRELLKKALVFTKKDQSKPVVVNLRNNLIRKFGQESFDKFYSGKDDKGREIGFKIQNHNRNTVAHLNDNPKSYKRILLELKEGLIHFKAFLDIG